MRKYYWILLFAVGLSSCTKVSKLSDTAEIVSFTILDQTEGIILNKDDITITNNVVTIPLDYGRKLFPLTIKADIKFSSTTDDAISVDEEPLNLKEITFKDVYTPQTFYLISESRVPSLGKIILKDKANAEITNFNVTNYTEEEVSVTIRDNNIRINFKQDFSWPVTIEADIHNNGKIKAGSAESPFTFSGPKDIKQITLIADDNQDERVWNIQVVPTIENSNFESWVNIGTSKVNIDPTPGKGLGWATANNTFVQGTTPVPYQKGYAAQIQTGIQNLTGLGIGELITAGTIFTGYFQIKISALSNPPLMTYFGIPFITRPQSISFDAKYVAGAKFQQSERKDEKSPYIIKDIPGVDQGRVWVELLRWEGDGELEYHGDHAEPVEGLKVLGKGEMIFDGANTALQNWKNHTIPINYDNRYKDLEPTHISIVMTSSRQGDLFIGAKGSTLTVDNVVVNY